MKKMIFYVIMLSFFIVETGFVVGSKYYDGVVSGIVYDDDELEPLEDVRVVYNDLVVDLTEVDGYYSLTFEGLLEEEVKYYDVKFSKDNYQELIESLKVTGRRFENKDVYMWRE
ncbi:hypothetical protein [Gabonibacter chumensis]|uniref:hypothetical protein n=1 Tax=Gabonibacter chumensis TaxID=2972474 RepID=UPI0025741ABA|nr:hypothetical protein [Gabonibacter chumensis]MCR9013221.1 hypothetical protein [Gabonibacter chumensis]